MDSRRQSVVALLVVLLLFRWAGEGLEAFAGLSRRLQSIGLLGDVATRSKHTVRHVVQEPPTRMRPPDVEDAVRSKAADWAECMVQFGDGSYDAEEVWVFRRKDFEEFQRLIGLRLSYRKPGHGQEGPARYGEARREEVLLKQRRVQRHGLAPATERNRGIDPKRLLSTMHKVGIGSPDPQLPAPSDSIRANSKDAAMMLLEKRQRSIEKGEAGLRPTMKRRDYRLPLLVKYYKPKGLVTSMRHLNKKKGMEDLRSVVSFAGDEFELDLYHPIGQLAADASGLFLWSRSGHITRQLEDVRRGVVTVMEVEVWGTVNTPVLQEALARGVTLGVTGFEKTYSARVQEAYLVPDSPLQELRSRVIVCCVDGRAKIPAMLERCGYKVAAVKRVQVGGFSLGDMREGQLKAASPQEEAWACQLAGLPASEYPEGFLPEGTPRRQRRRKR